jgi:hypothetical protein
VQSVLGFFAFTEVTDPDAHEAYNEWHQFDHLPEQFSIDGITFGQRWVCSPRCAATRVAVSPLLARCHYMTLYVMRDADVIADFLALARTLHAEGRFFEAREAHLTGAFSVVSRRAAPRVGVSAAAVPFRPATGVYVVVGPALPDAALVGIEGVAGVWTFAAVGDGAGDDGRDSGGEGEGGRHISVAFVDGDLWDVAARLGEYCRGLGDGLEWAGPLERVDPYAWDWFR